MTSPPLNPSRCLAGVDEAGLGPVLGPLVVAGVAMRGPEGIDPWRSLRRIVARNKPSDRHFHVADSKRVKQGVHGHLQLERTALGFWSAWTGQVPATVEALLAASGVDLAVLRECPWYEDLARPLPVWNDRGDIELRAHLLQRAMVEKEVELLHLAMRPVEVGEFNRLIDTTDNKSDAHFDAYGRVLADILCRLPDGAHVVADRCGGRVRYREKLKERMPEAHIRKLREGPLQSVYTIRQGDAAVRVTFACEGEDLAFPTALASCLAKYVRELLMSVLNAWFIARMPALKPTAGYYSDGKRFVTEVEGLVASAGLPRALLVRVR